MSWTVPETQPDISNEAEEPKKDYKEAEKSELCDEHRFHFKNISLDRALEFYKGNITTKDSEVIATAKKFYKFITEGK